MNMKRQTTIALSFLVVLASRDSIADEWTAAAPTITSSRNTNILVRITPGSNLGAVVGFEGEKKGTNATATWFKYDGTDYRKLYETSLLNPIAPVNVVVANSGAIITLDNWHNMGHGPVITIYSAQAKLLKSYKLDEVFSVEEINNIPRSVSSIWWRCSNSYEPRIDNETGAVVINDALNGTITVNPMNGNLHREREVESCCDTKVCEL